MENHHGDIGDDELRDALVGTSSEAEQAARPRGTTAPVSDQQTREAMQPRDLDVAPPASDDAIIRRAKAASPGARNTVMILSGSVILILFMLTFFVIVNSGLDALSLITLVVLGFLAYGLVGAATYKGEDPLAKLRELDDENVRRDDARRAARHAEAEAKRAAARESDSS